MKNKKGFGLIEIIIFASIVALLAALVIPGFTKAGDRQREINKTVKYELRQLNIKSQTEGNVSGTFFLGCGGISGSSEENLLYYFYARTSNGIKLFRVRHEQVSFFEDASDETGWVIIKSNIRAIDGIYNKGGKYYEIHIPKNSIIFNVNINIKGVENEK